MGAAVCVCGRHSPGDMCQLVHAGDQPGEMVLELRPQGMAGARGLPARGSTTQLQQPESPTQPGGERTRSQAEDGDVAKHLKKVSGGGWT